MSRSLLQECLTNAPDAETGVQSFIETVTRRYRAIQPRADQRIVQCNWRVCYRNKADFIVTILTTVFSLLAGGFILNTYKVRSFQSYHNLTLPEATAYIKNVNTRKKQKTLLTFLSKLFGVGFLLISITALVLIFIVISSNLPGKILLEYDFGVIVTGIAAFVCLLIMVALLSCVYVMAYWDVPPNTEDDLNGSGIYLEKVTVLQVVA